MDCTNICLPEDRQYVFVKEKPSLENLLTCVGM